MDSFEVKTLICTGECPPLDLAVVAKRNDIRWPPLHNLRRNGGVPPDQLKIYFNDYMYTVILRANGKATLFGTITEEEAKWVLHNDVGDMADTTFENFQITTFCSTLQLPGRIDLRKAANVFGVAPTTDHPGLLLRVGCVMIWLYASGKVDVNCARSEEERDRAWGFFANLVTTLCMQDGPVPAAAAAAAAPAAVAVSSA